MGKSDGYSIGINEQNSIKVKTPNSMDIDELIGNKAAITLMLWDYQKEKDENISLKKRLDDELKCITTTQVENIKNAISPLFPRHKSMKMQYIHGSLQSMIGTILLPIIIGILLYVTKYSLNDLWAMLGDFFTNLSNNK